MKVLMQPDDWKKYPECPKEFPDELLSETQAQRNHSQTLYRLNERGGLSPLEMIANVYCVSYDNVVSVGVAQAIEIMKVLIRKSNESALDKHQQISTLIHFIEDARKELEIKEGDSAAGVKFEQAYTELSKKYDINIKLKK